MLLAAAGVTALALIGGLALFAFTKLYGIVFLGAPRTHEVAEMHEADNYRIAAMALPAAGILFIGLLPWTVLPLLTKVAATLLPGLGAGRQPAAELPLWAGLTQITLVAAVLIAATALLLVAKRRALRRRTVASGPTWGCGFTAVNTRMQYTGESFVEGLESIVHPFTEEVVEGKAVDKQEIFPSAHDFDIRRKDRVARLFSAWWVESLRLLNARVMRLRTGKINHYILFALLFIVLVFPMFHPQPTLMTTLLNILLLVAVALSITGVVNRTRARLAGRRGPHFTQHLHNTALLLRKGAVYSTTTSALFRTAPALYLAAAVTALLFIPVGDLPPVVSFPGDLVCFIYLLALSRAALILAAMDTGSSFEGMGASREALYGALVEPALLLTTPRWRS